MTWDNYADLIVVIVTLAALYAYLRWHHLAVKYAALKRDRAIRTAELSKALRETRDRIMSWPLDDTETCMCGSPVSDHGIGDGHSPVSMADHAVTTLVNDINKVLGE